MELRSFISGFYNKEIILDYPDGPNGITGCLKVEERGGRVRARRTAV